VAGATAGPVADGRRERGHGRDHETGEGGGAERDDRRDPAVQPQPLEKTVGNILEEARMVLPGIQTLFGFQLIVVFEQSFQDRLSDFERGIHLTAMGLIAIATALVLTPAAYHRQVEPRSVSRRFVALATHLLSWSMVPLMVALSLDFYLVALIATGNELVALGLAAALFLVFLTCWRLLPRWRRLQDAVVDGEP
jgi:Family of unknown function (DUF6328)